MSAGLVGDGPAGGEVEVEEVGAVLAQTFRTLVSDPDTLGEDQLLHVRAVVAKLPVGRGRK